MTDEQDALIKRLNRCTFGVGSYDKRFVRDISYVAKHDPTKELTPKQAKYLEWLHYHYRKQLHEPDYPKPVIAYAPPENTIPTPTQTIIMCGRTMSSQKRKRDAELEQLRRWNEGKPRESANG